MATSRDLEDFTSDVKDMMERISKNSSLVRDILIEIGDSNELKDRAEQIIEDMFDDADQDDSLFERDGFSRALLDETVAAIVGVLATKIYSRRDIEDLPNAAQDGIEDGLDAYEKCLDRLDGGRDSRRDRSRSSRSSRSNRDRDDRSSRSNRDDRDDRDRDRGRSRSSRSSRSNRSSRSSRDSERVERAKPYNRNRGREEREERSERERTPSARGSRYTRNTRKDPVESTAVSPLEALGIDANDVLEFIENRTEFKRWLASGKPEPTKAVVVNNKLLKNDVVGAVLDNQHALKNGEVVDVEHYMDHELVEKARRANMERYGIKPAVPVKLPTREEIPTFMETSKLKVVEVETQTLDRVASDMLDYTDVSPFARRLMKGQGDYVMSLVNHINYTSMPKELVIVGCKLPTNFKELYQYITVVRTMFADSEDIPPTTKRFFFEYDMMATETFNQCLSMIGANFHVENFCDDYVEAMAAIRGLASYQQETYADIADRVFESALMIDCSIGDERMELTLRRTTPVLWVEEPLDIHLSNPDGYNRLTARSAPNIYQMLDSVLGYRSGLSELLVLSGSKNRYVVNIARTSSGMPIIVREI